jgi:phospholipid/cholesterol/gamma-HCH transport system permease protein
MNSHPRAEPPRLTIGSSAGVVQVALGGAWRIGEPTPEPALVEDAITAERSARVQFDSRAVTSWGSTLVLFAADVFAIADAAHVAVDRSGLPDGVQRLLALVEAPGVPAAPPARRRSALVRIGMRVLARRGVLRAFLAAIGERTLALGRLVRGRAKFRPGELLVQMQATGASALGIVGLVAGLLGFVIAFISAAQLQSLGSSLYVAKLVGIAMVRDLGPMMAGIVVAGRTGAAFAAELGTMQVTQEIDALTTLGIPPLDFVVIPRVLAVTLTMPLLCVYADVIGVIGGAAVGVGLMHIAPGLYLAQTLHAVSLTQLAGGLVKAATYGFLIGEASCYMGLRATRSAADIGSAATAGVVASTVLVIAASALYAYTFYRLGI